MRERTLCIDLFCGLGGWTEGFLAEGYDVIGFDIEQHVVADPDSISGSTSSKSSARKAASARIAKIPFPLANHIARCFANEIELLGGAA